MVENGMTVDKSIKRESPRDSETSCGYQKEVVSISGMLGQRKGMVAGKL